MKPELLEYLVRHCVREVLTQIKEVDEDPTKGAPAPPAAGQGTADQPEIPKKDSPPEENPSEPETPPQSPELKGVKFVNPKDKAKLQTVRVQGNDDASIERSLHQQGARIAGSNVKVAISTSRMVKDALRNPNTAVYLYLGKYDPNSDEIFLMADKSLQVAKDGSIAAGEMTGSPVGSLAPSDFHPDTAGSTEFAQRMSAQAGGTPRYGIDEKLIELIRKTINEVLDKK